MAIACCSAALRHRKITHAALARVFAAAPDRARRWRQLPSALDDSHGETFFRLWTLDAGLHLKQQVVVEGVGQIDFQLGQCSYVEIDGGQHDPLWTGDTPSTWERDHDRDTTVAIDGGRTLRFTYRQLYSDWPRLLAAVHRAIGDDRALSAYRRAHPYRAHTKTQENLAQWRVLSENGAKRRESPAFSAGAMGYATPAMRGVWNVVPNTRSDAPTRSRYGVAPPIWNG